jgi:radical SAM protein with 4Fe4S-binding SPASM domain
MLFSLLKNILLPGKAPGRSDVPAVSPVPDAEDLTDRITANAAARRQLHLDWPAFVHLETIALCNAACSFCPYPTMERKGERMPDALIEKVIGDLEDIPREVPFQIAPYKVSEPFLEPRLFDILDMVNARLPNAYVSLISNGTALTERKIDQMLKVRKLAYLNISLNFDNPGEYQAVMKLPFDRTLRRLGVLHERKLKGEVPFPVRLTRVSDGSAADARYFHWVKNEFPAFEPIVTRRNDWIGDVPGDPANSEVPDAPCHRWFDLSITATGKVAMCCMDGDAKYIKGDVNDHHVLEIYNQPHLKRMRETLVSRRMVGDPCNRCTYLSY